MKNIFTLLVCLPSILSADGAVFTEINPQDSSIGWTQVFDIQEKLYEGKSEYQDILLFTHKAFGRVLALDGVVQTTEWDEPHYHEMLNHVPLLAHPNPKNVLIIGGGDGGSLREVLRHKSVEQVTMVDLDGLVVEVCQKYLPKLSKGAFQDPRVELLIQDGLQYVKQTSKRFDVIICDTTDPVGPGKVLFSEEFYGDLYKILTPSGIITTQNGLPFTDGNTVTETGSALKKSFKHVKFYVSAVPTYMGGFMAFGFATNDEANTARDIDYLRARLSTLDGKMRYYTPELHNASFALPQYILDFIP